MNGIRNKIYHWLRWSEKYTKTDMVYLVKEGFWVNLNLVSSTIMSFLLTIAFARMLPKESYGAYQFIISIGTIIGTLTLTGINRAITQAVARGYEGSFIKSIVSQLKYGLIPLGLSFILGGYYLWSGNQTIATAVIVLGFLVPILNSLNTYTAFLNGRKNFRTLFWSSQVLNFSYYPIMILALFFIKSPLILILINFVTNTLVTFFLFYYTIKKHVPNSEEDPATITYGKHLSLMNIIPTIASQIDNILVFHFLGAANLAIYVFATSMPERFFGLIKNISDIALPKFAQKDKEEIKKNIFHKSIRFTILALIGATVYAAIAPFVYSLLFPQYHSSIPFSQVYAFMIAVTYMSVLPITSLLATRSQKELYLYNTVSPIVWTVLMLALLNFYGIWGLIVAKGVSGIINAGLSLFLVKNHR